ncbi:FadR/GntR family transcriptional regulator [Pseudodesulfovibrio sediminis]|uniref:GntR family transcriptional regulator n=1 Tax=Pseudodesulfovibrio sediminis TaxID=2810563 RepID=A0ABN6EZ99_9BACT|nr:FadR/GntR family transcriptional regulator [Pseudodesulfovibrio sediminis]BCS90118.1 GntR family transcriptional regulator [Pseudodesulfovibrio sediminis]
MDIKRVRKKSISEKIVAQLKEMIGQGQLKPGDRLPAERNLAEMFGVSRTTVREGIKALAESGVLESRQGAGTFVSEVDPSQVSVIESVLSGDHDMRDVFAVRKMLEPEIAALAAQKRSPAEIYKLEAILSEQEEAVRKGETGSDYDQRFHRMLADASGNLVLREMVKALHDAFAQSRSMIIQSEERQRASLAAHRAIVEAVKHGHGMQAERAMREHLDEVENIIFDNQK